MGIRGKAPGAHIFCAPHGGAVAPQRRKIRYPRQAKPAGDFGRPMRAAIPMLGRFLPLTTQAFLMCPILRGKMGLKYAARAGGRGRARWAERAEPAHEGWFAWFGAGCLSRRYWGLRPLAPWGGALTGGAGSAKMRQAREAGPSSGESKEVKPMSATDTIALLMLIIAAIRLGIELKR